MRVREKGKCEGCGKETSRKCYTKCGSCRNRERHAGKPMPDFLVDEEYREEVMKYRWHLHPRGYIWGRPYDRKGRTKVLLHVYVWTLAHGSPPPRMLDHINRDKADNRLENLRLASTTLNGLNRESSGVGYNKTNPKPWHPYLKAKGRYRKHLGSFSTREEAEKVAREAREILIEFEALRCNT